jgi:hypothetical protein
VLLWHRSQRRWFLFTVLASLASVGVYIYLDRTSATGWLGGSRPGLIYAFVGGVLMLLAAVLTPLRYFPGGWLFFPRKFWLRIHVWLGTLSGVFILCHSGFRFGGPFERVLMILFLVTLITGIVGLALQQFLPGWLFRRIPCEVPYDQIPSVTARLVASADALVREILKAAIPASTRETLDRFHGELVRPFLSEPRDRGEYFGNPAKLEAAFATVVELPGAGPARDKLEQIRAFCDERRLLAEQERLIFWMHSWLYVHVPVSAAMLVLAGFHAVMATYY